MQIKIHLFFVLSSSPLYQILPIFYYNHYLLIFILFIFKTTETTLVKLKFTVPFLFMTIWFPVCFIILLRDFQIIFNNNPKYSNYISVDLAFTFSMIINHCMPMIAGCLHAFSNEHNRLVFRYIFCFICKPIFNLIRNLSKK